MTSPRLLHIEQQGDILILSPARSVGSFETDELQNEWVEIRQRLASGAVRHVIVDLHQIAYFGSAILDCIAELGHDLKQIEGSKLVICNPSLVGMEVLAAVNFPDHWPVFHSRKEALAVLGGEQ